ncbi:unnamed protein product, partial [Leptidea sinapis]
VLVVALCLQTILGYTALVPEILPQSTSSRYIFRRSSNHWCCSNSNTKWKKQ